MLGFSIRLGTVVKTSICNYREVSRYPALMCSPKELVHTSQVPTFYSYFEHTEIKQDSIFFSEL